MIQKDGFISNVSLFQVVLNDRSDAGDLDALGTLS